MKPYLCAAALATACAGAHAQTPSVNLYGVMDVGLVHQSNVLGSSLNSMGSGLHNTSRWGLRGSEDLGGGLKALFNVEAEIGVDSGTAPDSPVYFNRESKVGLQGGFGRVLVGRQTNGLYELAGAANARGLYPFGSIVRPATAAGWYSSSGKTRMDNSLRYDTPEFGGFSANVTYALGEVVGNSSARRGVNVGGVYRNGPLVAGLSYLENKDATGTTNNKAWVAGGAYAIGEAKVFAGWSNAKDPSVSTKNFDLGWIGATYALSPVMGLNGSYYKLKDKTGANKGNSTFVIGGTYALSKRTSAYLDLARSSNQAAAEVSIWDSNNKPTLGQGQSALAIGMIHAF